MTIAQSSAEVDRPLWRDRDFVHLWSAQFLSSLVMGVTNVALPWLILEMTGSPAQTALVATFLNLPYFVLSIPAGALADRFDRRAIMLGSTLLRALVFATVPLAALTGRPQLLHLYLVAFLSGALRAPFDGANFGALVNVAGRHRLTDANAKLSAAFSFGLLVGPQIAGVLIAAIGAALTMTVNTIAYLASFGHVHAIRRSFTIAPTASAQGWRFWADIKEGARFVWQTRLIRILTLLGFGNGFTGGGISGTLVIFARNALHLSERETGLLFAAGGLGAIVVMFLMPWLARIFPVVRLTLWGLTLNALLCVPLLLAPNFLAALVLLFAWQGTFNLVLINGLTIRQQITPDHLQGRVNTVGRAIASGGMPIGAAFAGLLAEWLGIRGAYGILALGVATSAILAWRSPLRTFDSYRPKERAPIVPPPIDTGRRNGTPV